MKKHLSLSSVIDCLLDGTLVSEIVVEVTNLLSRCVQKPFNVRPVGNFPILAILMRKATSVLEVTLLVVEKPAHRDVAKKPRAVVAWHRVILNGAKKATGLQPCVDALDEQLLGRRNVGLLGELLLRRW